MGEKKRQYLLTGNPRNAVALPKFEKKKKKKEKVHFQLFLSGQAGNEGEDTQICSNPTMSALRSTVQDI